MGQEVTTVLETNLAAGYHTYRWAAPAMSSGIYFAQMTTGDGFTKTMKLMYVK